MEDSNIIATLIATRGLPKPGFQLDHNEKQYRAHTSVPALFSRESTPYAEEVPVDKDDTAHRLELSFNKPPKKNVNNSFVFGWSPDCDIQLADRRKFWPEDRDYMKHISKMHFSITFDEQRRVILRDTSTNGTSVSYDGKAGEEIQSHFTWIIFPDSKTIEASIPSMYARDPSLI